MNSDKMEQNKQQNQDFQNIENNHFTIINLLLKQHNY